MQLSLQRDGARFSGKDADDWISELLSVGESLESSFQRVFMLQQDDIKEFLYAETRDRYQFLADLAGVGELQHLDDQLKAELRRLRDAARQKADERQREDSRLAAMRKERTDSEAILSRQAEYLTAQLDDQIAELRTLLGTSAGASVSDLAKRADERLRAIDEAVLLIEENERAAQAAQTRADQFASARSDLEKVESQIAELEPQLRRLDAEAGALDADAASRLREQEQRKQLATLALDQLGDRCPVCDQDYDREHALQHLRSLLEEEGEATKLRAAAQQKRQEARKVSEQLVALRSRAAELHAKVEAATEAQRTAERARTAAEGARAEACQLLLVPENEAPDLAALRTRLEHFRTVLRDVQANLDAVRHRDNLHQRLPVLERDLAKQEELVSRLTREAHDLNVRSAQAEAICQWLGDHIVDATTQVVRSTAPLVNELYARLDVHPTFRRFDFKSDRRYAHGHIRPWVYDDDLTVDGNAAHVMSSAQLNALAVCLFLALNLSSPALLESVMLDDPVQNMDDVNVLSLVDVLRALRTQRQVIITTHDPDLAQLLWRKLRPLHESQRTVWIAFSNWTTDGPEVTVESRELDMPVERLELVPA
jgi:DNA repair exonuclease SbcCD ATPase subunit